MNTVIIVSLVLLAAAVLGIAGALGRIEPEPTTPRERARREALDQLEQAAEDHDRTIAGLNRARARLAERIDMSRRELGMIKLPRRSRWPLSRRPT
jgi:hypothetical protein